jgi:hypothetical protein
VAFWSYGSDLVPGDNNAKADVFVRDLLTKTLAEANASRDMCARRARAARRLPSRPAEGPSPEAPQALKRPPGLGTSDLGSRRTPNVFDVA